MSLPLLLLLLPMLLLLPLLLLGLPLMLPLMTPLVPPEVLAPLLLQVGAVDERLMGLVTAPAEEIVAVARRAASSAGKPEESNAALAEDEVAGTSPPKISTRLVVTVGEVVGIEFEGCAASRAGEDTAFGSSSWFSSLARRRSIRSTFSRKQLVLRRICLSRGVEVADRDSKARR